MQILDSNLQLEITRPVIQAVVFAFVRAERWEGEGDLRAAQQEIANALGIQLQSPASELDAVPRAGMSLEQFTEGVPGGPAPTNLSGPSSSSSSTRISGSIFPAGSFRGIEPTSPSMHTCNPLSMSWPMWQE